MSKPKIGLLLLLVMLSAPISTAGGQSPCGGVFTAKRGVLQTPNFPAPFPAPLHCKWVIDATHVNIKNHSIIIYLTQLFVFEGLSFTDYIEYGSGYEIKGKLDHRVTESNITKVKWLRTYESYVVIKLDLETADSVHLRVLDRFLDVYGFNITYEITDSSVRPGSCTMFECGFTGVCYDHFNKFSCDCFDGYSGPQCSDGLKSLCFSSNGVPACKNNATCIHCGSSAITCRCPKGYTGRTCEVPVQAPTKKGCDYCRNYCPNSAKGDSCQCSKGNVAGPDQIGYSATMHLSNLPDLDEVKLKNYVRIQLLRSLKNNFTKIINVSIDSINHFMSGVDVGFHFYWLKKDEKKVRAVLNKWAEKGLIGNITVADKDIPLKTTLQLVDLSVNQPGVVRESDEFILSCAAKGSQSMTFKWSKDGLPINASSTSHKWTRIITENHINNEYTALLGIQSAQILDDGYFTCQVEDYNIQQCMSKRIQIGRPPLITIEPMSLTVQKGENFTIKCITQDEAYMNGKNYNYFWTKAGTLLPVRTATERYEVLYPYGSILQVFNVEKDVDYSCSVQYGTVSSKKMVTVKVVDKINVKTCPKHKYLSLWWPETAPNTDCVQACPVGYTGIVTRNCNLGDLHKPSWRIPDFSECTHNQLVDLQKQMELLRLGYVSILPEDLVKNILTSLIENTRRLLPGEGVKILSITQEMIDFVEKLGFPVNDNTTRTVFAVIDRVLQHRNALLNQTHVGIVQQVMSNHLKAFADDLIANESARHISYGTMELTILNLSKIDDEHFYIPPLGKSYDNHGITVDGTLSLKKHSKNILSLIDYKNISLFLPPRSYLRIKDGSEIKYEILSEILNLLYDNTKSKIDSLKINFPHKIDKTENFTNLDSWSVKCAMADTFTHTWDIYTCNTIILDDFTTQCVCPFANTFALLITTAPAQLSTNEEDDPRRYVLIGSCSLCMALALFTSACLATSCWMQRCTCLIFLKLQCSLSVFSTALLFTLATVTGPPKIYYMYFITLLETFILLSLSSHLSKLLIVFTELVHLPRPVTSKQTVIGIISGVPIITVFGSHLAYRTMNIKLQSWWMTVYSLAFNLYVTVIGIITLLFLFVYVIVMKKLLHLIEQHEKHTKSIKKRIALLKRSACLFAAISVLSISSIVYINIPQPIWSLYQFCGSNILLGLALIICYVIKGETEFQNLFTNKSKLNKDDKFFSVESTSSPLNFLAKQEAEMENESGIFLKPDIHPGSSIRTTECHSMMDTLCKPQNISATFESCLQNSTSFCDGGTQVNGSEKLECYNSSPQHFRKFPPNNRSHSPDILASKVCVELDLVASVQNKSQLPAGNSPSVPARRGNFTKVPEEAISRILETGAKAETRTQPDGHENKAINVCELDNIPPPPPPPSADKLDGMLDRICHDLDFLLNRSGEVEMEENVVATSSLRRISKPPSLSVIHQIKEEEELDTSTIGDLPEPITDIMRTEC